MDYKHRHTKIIFTVGPSTIDQSVLEELIKAKVDICRLNMAHGSQEWTQNAIQTIRRACAAVNRHIAIMMDIKGPEIRTGDIDGTWDLQKGEIFDLYTDSNKISDSSIKGVSVNYPGIINDVEIGNIILVDSGLIHLRVLEKLKDLIRCEIDIPGPLKSKRHINLPGIQVNLPSLTDKDKSDLILGIKENIEFVALSFVRDPHDIIDLRNFLKSYNSKAKIIAKIEDQSALRNLDEIIKESDGIMVARGDLGIECPYEQIPNIQKKTIERCINLRKPVIVATHMLESMIFAPIPTRAEVSDVAIAVREQADCIMLSGETSIGTYPLKCVEVMRKIAHEIEHSAPLEYNKSIHLESPKNKMLRSCIVLAQELENIGIVVFTRSGKSAQLISSLRPSRCPLYVFTDQDYVARQLRILWGIEPFHISFSQDKNVTITSAIQCLKDRGSINFNDYLIILTNIHVNGSNIDTIQLRKVE